MADPFYVGDGLTVFSADLLDALPLLEPGSIDAVVTSPPYAMQRKSTYGGVPEKDYPDWTVAWMDALRPALKDDGSVIINIRPHIKNGQISDYVLRTRLALRDAGWCELEELIWHKKGGAPLGSIARPRRTWESLLWFGKHGRAYSSPKSAGQYREGVKSGRGRQGPHIARSLADAPGGSWSGVARVPDVVEMSTRLNANDSDLNRHPAPFPWQLAEWCAKLICPPGGTVLDPFAGSGSTAIAALHNGFQSVAIEREPEYAQMIVDRYSAELAKVDSTLELGLVNAES